MYLMPYGQYIMGSRDSHSGSLILEFVLLTICFNSDLASVNLMLYHLPYMCTSDTPCSRQHNKSPCLGFLPPLSLPSSEGVLLPRACFSNTNQTIQSSYPQRPPLLGFHIPGHYSPAIITLWPDTREQGTALCPQSTESIQTS